MHLAVRGLGPDGEAASALLQAKDGGAEGVRTPDLLNAIQALYQLSYDPIQQGQSVESGLNCQNDFEIRPFQGGRAATIFASMGPAPIESNRGCFAAV